MYQQYNVINNIYYLQKYLTHLNIIQSSSIPLYIVYIVFVYHIRIIRELETY